MKQFPCERLFRYSIIFLDNIASISFAFHYCHGDTKKGSVDDSGQSGILNTDLCVRNLHSQVALGRNHLSIRFLSNM